MSRNKSKDPPRKPSRCRKRPSNAAATAKPAKVWPEKLIGAKYVRLLEKHLRNLHSDAAHGNRRLFLDDAWEGFPLRKDYKDDFMLELPK